MSRKTIVPRSAIPLTKARKLAREAADRYFDALAGDIPCDEGPGSVNLTEAAMDIADAVAEARGAGEFNEQDLYAGYLLGVEIGRRMAGGAR